MKIFQLFSLLLCSLLLISFGARAETACAGLPSDNIDLEIVDKPTEIQYDFTRGKKELTRLQKGQSQAFSELEDRSFHHPVYLTGDSLGLNSVRFRYELYVFPAYKQVGYNQHCIRVNRIFLKLELESIIFVAKEYKGNQCAFNHIMDHEMLHHKTHMHNKSKYVGWLETDLKAVANEIVKNYKPVPQKSMQAMYDKMLNDINDAVSVYIHKMYVDINETNQRIDAPSQYLKFGRKIKKCYGKSW